MADFDVKSLIRQALKARERAFCPISDFAVGAALLTEEGKVYPGCNIEVGGMSPSNCAERTAIFKAVSEGDLNFHAVAVVGGPRGKAPASLCPPCGVCRQVMVQFCDPETFQVVVAVDEDNYKIYTLSQLLPDAFRRTDYLEKELRYQESLR